MVSPNQEPAALTQAYNYFVEQQPDDGKYLSNTLVVYPRYLVIYLSCSFSDNLCYQVEVKLSLGSRMSLYASNTRSKFRPPAIDEWCARSQV